jgi:hypothetical protein
MPMTSTARPPTTPPTIAPTGGFGGVGGGVGVGLWELVVVIGLRLLEVGIGVLVVTLIVVELGTDLDLVWYL